MPGAIPSLFPRASPRPSTELALSHVAPRAPALAGLSPGAQHRRAGSVLAFGGCLRWMAERWRRARRFGSSPRLCCWGRVSSVFPVQAGKCRQESAGRKDLGKQIQEPGKSAVTEEAERGLRRVASPHPVTHFPLQFPACGEEAASTRPWGSRCCGAVSNCQALGVMGASRSAHPRAGNRLQRTSQLPDASLFVCTKLPRQKMGQEEDFKPRGWRAGHRLVQRTRSMLEAAGWFSGPSIPERKDAAWIRAS